MTRCLSSMLFVAALLGGIEGVVAGAAEVTGGTNTTAAAPGTGSSRLDFPSFKIITERNIFDPHRSGRGIRTAPREEERRVRAETFALLGTMSYQKGRFAFFDGTDSQFRKVLQPTDSIAGFKIAEVAPTCVKLQTTNGQILELCVGMQMRHREEEGWQLSGTAESSSGGQSSSSTSGPAAGESEDVIKRLMAQREKDGGSTESTPEPAPVVEEKKSDRPASADEGDEVLKRLLQKREQETK